MPLGSLSSQVDKLDHQHPVVVVCATGNRSVSAAALLGQKKFEKIYNVLGGTMAWMQQGLPLEH
jgi:rhodanese-related sulfurtransferase